MHKIYCYIVIAIVLISSCHKEKCIDSQLPMCIQSILENDKVKSIKTIRSQEINKVVHYWINTDASHWDGVEYILDKDCNKVCFICGECAPPECIKDYDLDQWDLIWTR